MSDEFGEFSGLEGELRQFVPGVVAGDLRGRVAEELDARVWRVGDRCLAGAMAMGLAACLVIAGMLGMDLMEGRRGGSPSGMYAEAPVMAQTREFLAQLAAGYETRVPVATAPN